MAISANVSYLHTMRWKCIRFRDDSYEEDGLVASSLIVYAKNEARVSGPKSNESLA